MKLFLSVAAIFAWIFGLGLLLVPSEFYAPTGITITPLVATIAQAHGATLFGLGTINWFARNAAGQGLKAILLGNVIVQVLSFLVALHTFFLIGKGAIVPLVIHSIMGGLFLFFLLKYLKSSIKNKNS